MKQIFFQDYVNMASKPSYQKSGNVWKVSKNIHVNGLIVTGSCEYSDSGNYYNVPDYDYMQRFSMNFPKRFADNSLGQKNSTGPFSWIAGNRLEANLAKNPIFFMMDYEFQVGDEISLAETMFLSSGYWSGEYFFTYNYLFLYD